MIPFYIKEIEENLNLIQNEIQIIEKKKQDIIK